MARITKKEYDAVLESAAKTRVELSAAQEESDRQALAATRARNESISLQSEKLRLVGILAVAYTDGYLNDASESFLKIVRDALHV